MGPMLPGARPCQHVDLGLRTFREVVARRQVCGPLLQRPQETDAGRTLAKHGERKLLAHAESFPHGTFHSQGFTPSSWPCGPRAGRG